MGCNDYYNQFYDAQSILLLIQSHSFPDRPAFISATDKLRAALVASGFEPDVDVEIECTSEEARFLARCRDA